MSKKKNRKKALKLALKRAGKIKTAGNSLESAAQAPVENQAPASAPQAQDKLFAGFSDSKRAIFEEAGLTSSEAFAQATEKEVLALKGIGPAAVQQLKDNGVSFKA